jgi:hypothetical protein
MTAAAKHNRQFFGAVSRARGQEEQEVRCLDSAGNRAPGGCRGLEEGQGQPRRPALGRPHKQRSGKHRTPDGPRHGKHGKRPGTVLHLNNLILGRRLMILVDVGPGGEDQR